jgi:protein-S-isoprenylcysteine O-methyltransferase Ste14
MLVCDSMAALTRVLGPDVKTTLRAIWTFAGTLALYLGLSLLGWGMADVGGFFSSPARLTYAVVIASFAGAVAYQAIVAPEGIVGSSGLMEKRVPRQAAVGYAMLLILAIGLILLPLCDRRGLAAFPESTLVRWPGVILTAIGYVLVFLSGIYLGRQYSAEVTIQENHNLITAGPYRLVRHPRYLGILLLTLGASLAFRTWAGLVLFPFVLALLLWRIRDEEALMQREFGEAWRAYSRRAWRLVPYVY